MKTLNSVLVILILFVARISIAQIKSVIRSRQVAIDDGELIFMRGKYVTASKDLDKKIKNNEADTTVLFQRALTLDLSNNLFSKPYQLDTSAYNQLLRACDLIQKAFDLKMKSLHMRVLRAQIYHDLAYRFTGEESWKLTKDDINRRRALFETFKELANKYYK